MYKIGVHKGQSGIFFDKSFMHDLEDDGPQHAIDALISVGPGEPHMAWFYACRITNKVCPLCEGRGVVDNPSIDGVLICIEGDVKCPRCHGRNVVSMPVVDWFPLGKYLAKVKVDAHFWQLEEGSVCSKCYARKGAYIP